MPLSDLTLRSDWRGLGRVEASADAGGIELLLKFWDCGMVLSDCLNLKRHDHPSALSMDGGKET